MSDTIKITIGGDTVIETVHGVKVETINHTVLADPHSVPIIRTKAVNESPQAETTAQPPITPASATAQGESSEGQTPQNPSLDGIKTASPTDNALPNT